MSLNKVAIVTAAGKGIGAGVARRLAAVGYRVAALSPSGAAERLATELGGWGVTGSLTEPADTDRLVAGALERWGRVDGLVVNTGHPPKGPLLDVSDADWHAAFDLMFLSALRLIRAVAPAMRARGSGPIVILSSFVALEPAAEFVTSSVVRPGLLAFTRCSPTRRAPPASASTPSCRASSTACRRSPNGGSASRLAATPGSRRSPTPSPTCSPTAPPTSPARSCASTAV